jgi:predicted RNA-binding Zn ribbon-like protein
MSDVVASEPGNRAPAPDRLKLVQEFLNSIDIEEGTEQFHTPAQLRTWLVNRGLAKPENLRLTSKDLERARRFRELLRGLAASNNGLRTPSTLHEELNRELARLTFVSAVKGNGVATLQPAGIGIERALSQLAAILIQEMIRGRWSRMKACAQDICRWVFYDHSRSRTGTWCTMAVCGSRAKSRTYYRRRTAG